MGVLLISLVLLVIGILIPDKGYYSIIKDYAKTLMIIIGIFGIIFSLLSIIGAYINTDMKYQTMIEQKESIEYRIQQANENTGIIEVNELHQEVLNYNRELREYKTWSDSFWVGWFYESHIADLDYIDLSGGIT